MKLGRESLEDEVQRYKELICEEIENTKNGLNKEIEEKYKQITINENNNKKLRDEIDTINQAESSVKKEEDELSKKETQTDVRYLRIL